MDTIFYNGIVITMDEMHPRAQAVAVKDGLVFSVGSNEEMLALKNDATQCVDLGGAALYPGMVDSHMHALNLGASRRGVMLDGIKKRADVLAAIERKAAVTPKGMLIQARGFNQDLWDDPRLITRAELDQIAPDHPVKMVRVCGHLVVANTRTIELVGVTRDTKVPDGGEMDFDQGFFSESALSLINRDRVDEGVQVCKQLLLSVLNECADSGLTGIYSDDLGTAGFSMHTVIAAYRELEAEGKMPLRVVQQCNLGGDDEELKEFLKAGYHYGQGSAMYRLGPRKAFADGSLGARTAWLNAPYADAPGVIGVPVFTQEELNTFALHSHQAGLPFIVHAIGDGAVDCVLNAIEYARRLMPETSHFRDGIVHCQITGQETLRRIIDMKVDVYAQPVFTEYDLHICRDRVGAQLEKTSYNWKTLLDSGVCISSGSDCPVEPFAPAKNIYCAVTRKDFDGFPEGGWLPEQCLTVDEAVYCHTVMAARTVGLEAERGRVKKGLFADFTIFPRDLSAIDPMEIQHQKPLMTVVGGKIRLCPGA